MSDETKRKPFARLEDRSIYEQAWVVGDVVLEHAPDGWPRGAYEWRARLCADINAAHEVALAPLREALKTWGIVQWTDKDGKAADQFKEGMPTERCRSCGRIARNWKPLVHTSSCDIAAALSDNPPEYVPKTKLDEAEAKLMAYRAAVDALDGSESKTHETVCAWLEAAGLKRPDIRWAASHNLVDLDRVNAVLGAASSRYKLAIVGHEVVAIDTVSTATWTTDSTEYY